MVNNLKVRRKKQSSSLTGLTESEREDEFDVRCSSCTVHARHYSLRFTFGLLCRQMEGQLSLFFQVKQRRKTFFFVVVFFKELDQQKIVSCRLKQF